MSENTFHFSLVSPEKVLLSEEVRMVTVPGTEGEFGVLRDHAPILSSLKDGVVVVEQEDGEAQRVFIAGGFADMNDNICTLLAEDAVKIEDIDKIALEKEREVLNEKLSMLSDGEEVSQEKEQLERALSIAEQKLSLAS